MNKILNLVNSSNADKLFHENKSEKEAVVKLGIKLEKKSYFCVDLLFSSLYL